MSKIILFNKPYGVLSQFTSCDGHPGLSGLLSHRGVYPAGRLDRDSEGLLILTDDGALQARISNPRFKLPKTYLVQVEGVVEPHHLAALRRGVTLRDGVTLPASARAIDAPELWPRTPAVRFRKNTPTTWLALTLREGRIRQVRRMTAAVGLPTLRLVRWSVGEWTLADLQPGEHRVEQIHLPSQNSHPKATARKDVRRRHHD